MARLAGVDLPPGKRAEIGLTYIYGIGRTRSKSLLYRCGIDFNKKIRDLTEDEVFGIAALLASRVINHCQKLWLWAALHSGAKD